MSTMCNIVLKSWTKQDTFLKSPGSWHSTKCISNLSVRSSEPFSLWFFLFGMFWQWFFSFIYIFIYINLRFCSFLVTLFLLISFLFLQLSRIRIWKSSFLLAQNLPFSWKQKIKLITTYSFINGITHLSEIIIWKIWKHIICVNKA